MVLEVLMAVAMHYQHLLKINRDREGIVKILAMELEQAMMDVGDKRRKRLSQM
jgi:hypothetical protein